MGVTLVRRITTKTNSVQWQKIEANSPCTICLKKKRNIGLAAGVLEAFLGEHNLGAHDRGKASYMHVFSFVAALHDLNQSLR